jgi:S-adenosylmethionine:tRNA ribosyltransferase-isomerase
MTTQTTRMLLVDSATRGLREGQIDELPELLAPGDLVVVNDAATLPASLPTRTARGDCVEVRLLDAPLGPFTRAVLFGAGDYRTPTEHRLPPPTLRVADTLHVGELTLHVRHIAALSSRLVVLQWPHDRATRFASLYRYGRPIQYSYVPEPVALWDVQTAFAGRPWSVEMPSAGRPLSARILLRLIARGVGVARLTHAAGLSATSDPLLDAALPLPERYQIPEVTAHKVAEARRARRRVLAVGTSVVRALEDSALQHGCVRAGDGFAKLVLRRGTPRRVTSGLLTGIHVPGESHYDLLQAFVDPETLARSVWTAQERGYRAHEFGDAALILPGILANGRAAA